MKSILSLCALFLTVVLLSAAISAGELGGDLKARIQAATAGQKIRVWIQLPVAQTARAVRQSSSVAAASTRDRHRILIQALEDGNRTSQSALVSALGDLKASKKADNIKQHWIVNVIEADIDASELAALAARPDVATVIEEPKIELIAPTSAAMVPPDQLAPQANFYTPNLVQIKADSAHALGYTGKGRVICTFDTGVDGTHRFLNRSWRGKGGSTADSIASWFDPVYHQHSPHVIANSLTPQHGTHVMGICVGRDVAGDSTIGVAPDAKWISAAVIDAPGASILDGFEWAADPDGDPSTSDDVPDVINHSWGYPSKNEHCQDIFYDAIDNLEALGIVNIFAAGNEGSTPTSIRNPANRANDSLDCFAVGNLDLVSTPLTPSISASSSRGPSYCNGAIKPNVVAPGTAILSSYPNGVLTTLSGTSMAAPHVAGLVALLKQKNPSATPEQIKTAILMATQHKPAWGWGTLPNNNYGWGEIDCMAALNALPAPTSPNIRLYDFAHGSVLPGSTITGQIRVRNLGSTAKNITAKITGTDPNLVILNDSVSFPANLAQDSIEISTGSISVQVSASVTSGALVSVPVTISYQDLSNTPLQNIVPLSLVIEPASVKSFVTQNANDISFSLTNFGVLGLGPASIFPAGGIGFTFQAGPDYLYEGGLILGTDSFHISTGIHDQLFEPMHDFLVAPGGNMILSAPGSIATQQTFSKFTDAGAHSPIGVEITQESYSFAPFNGFVLLRYIVRNTTASAINGLRMGLHLDWDLVNYSMNAGGWNAQDSILWQAYDDTLGNLQAPNNYRGIRMMQGTPTTGLTESGVIGYQGTTTDTVSNGYTAGEKWRSLIAGFGTATIHEHDSTDLFQMMATTLSIPAGGSDTIAFAIVAGATYPDIQSAAGLAREVYNASFFGAPQAFSCLKPTETNGSPVSTLLPTFVWGKAVDLSPSDTVKYTLQYALDSVFTLPVTFSNLTDTTFTTPDSLTDLTFYWWRVQAADKQGFVVPSLNTPKFKTDISTDVNGGGDNGLPKTFALFQNFPNPFNPSTVIAFDLPRASNYSLKIYDLLGQTVREFNGHAGAGRVQVTWDARNQASGVYFYRLTAGNFSATRKMLLLK